MAETTLIKHCGARDVSLEELEVIKAPEGTDTWFPVPHVQVYRKVTETLEAAGYAIARQRLAVARDDLRFFGTLDLESTIIDGITLAVGIRNSNDRSTPIGFCCGNRCFVCDNLAFTSEIVVSKRHTRWGNERYVEGLSKAVASLGQYQTQQAEWINRLRSWHLTREEADSIILRSFEEDLIGARQLPLLIDEWRNPEHEEFREPTGWSLWNAYTAVLGKTTQASQPAKAASMTIKLQGLLTPRIVDTTAKTIEAV